MNKNRTHLLELQVKIVQKIYQKATNLDLGRALKLFTKESFHFLGLFLITYFSANQKHRTKLFSFKKIINCNFTNFFTIISCLKTHTRLKMQI